MLWEVFFLDDSQYFDPGIEKTVSILTAVSNFDSSKPESAIQAFLPYIEPTAHERMNAVIKAISISRIVQRYSALSVKTQRIKDSRKDMLTELRQELDPHAKNVLDLFVKLTEIKELMEVIQLG